MYLIGFGICLLISMKFYVLCIEFAIQLINLDMKTIQHHMKLHKPSVIIKCKPWLHDDFANLDMSLIYVSHLVSMWYDTCNVDQEEDLVGGRGERPKKWRCSCSLSGKFTWLNRGPKAENREVWGGSPECKLFVWGGSPQKLVKN